jgi:hypothetical protein
VIILKLQLRQTEDMAQWTERRYLKLEKLKKWLACFPKGETDYQVSQHGLMSLPVGLTEFSVPEQCLFDHSTAAMDEGQFKTKS